MLVKNILELKDPDIFTIGATATAAEAAKLFKEKQIGFAIVEEAGVNVGTISERDIIHALSNMGAEVADKSVRDLMTTKIVTCQLDAPIDEVRAIMTHKRTRHVLVMEGDELMGLVSIGDVVKHSLDACEIDSEAMRGYISGEGYQ
ncbi:MAG: CBS domain-containing protein [Rhodospirillaceae bacterium]|nr:CBS domain-containing protein [Rhodospirillaceae bacterium]